MNDDETRSMLIEYMEKGFLENIIAMFRQDPSLYQFIPDMLGAESIRVRLGTAALVEELANGDHGQFRPAVQGILALLKHESPTIRGDAAYVLGLIKDPAAAVPLRERLSDENEIVREIASDALSEMDRERF